MLVLPYASEPIETFATAARVDEMQSALRNVKAQFGGTYPLVIGGKKVMTAELIQSTDPSNPGQVVGSAAKAAQEHADAALAAAWNAFESWKAWKQEDRSRVMLKAAQIMRRRKRELEAWLVYEIGKNFFEASAEVAEMIDFTEYYARQALKHVGSLGSLNAVPGEENESFYIPLGAGVTIWTVEFSDGAHDGNDGGRDRGWKHGSCEAGRRYGCFRSQGIRYLCGSGVTAWRHQLSTRPGKRSWRVPCGAPAHPVHQFHG